MGNCFERQALKVIIEGRKGERVSYITNKQLRNIKTYRDLFHTLGILTTHFKYLYSILDTNEVQFLHLSSDFKIKNLVICIDTEYHISFEILYC